MLHRARYISTIRTKEYRFCISTIIRQQTDCIAVYTERLSNHGLLSCSICPNALYRLYIFNYAFLLYLPCLQISKDEAQTDQREAGQDGAKLPDEGAR